VLGAAPPKDNETGEGPAHLVDHLEDAGGRVEPELADFPAIPFLLL
jgi:hypothetical protein